GIRDFHVTGVQTCALPISMFLIPLLGMLGAMLAVRARPPLRFFAWFAGFAALAGGAAALMVYPYFAARASFNLERSLDFASSYEIGRASCRERDCFTRCAV